MIQYVNGNIYDPNAYVPTVVKDKQQLAELLALTYKPIANGTLTEAAGAITITADEDGKAFNLEKARLLLLIPAVVTAATVKLRFNDIADTSYYDRDNSATAATTDMRIAQADTLFTAATTVIDCIGGDVLVHKAAVSSTSIPAISGYYYSSVLYGKNITGITKLYIFSGTFPIGTSYKLEGISV